MSLVFSLFYVFGLVYMVRRRFDLFTLTYLTSTVYFLPAFFGVTHDGTLPIVLNTMSFEQHLFYFYYFSLLLVFTWMFSTLCLHRRLPTNSFVNEASFVQDLKIIAKMSKISSVLAPLLLLLAWQAMGANLFSADKQVVLDNFSIFYALFQTTTLIFFFTSFICKNRFNTGLSILLILFDLFVGFRAIGAFALILAFSYSLFINFSIRKTLVFSFILVCGYGLASLYKSVTLAVKYGLGAGGLLTEFDFDSLVDSLLITESFTTQEVFAKTISSNITLPLEYPFEIIRILLPGVNNLLLGKGLGFNDYYQGRLFPHIPWGLGSNVWAEQYAIWGWIGPVFLVLFLFSLLYIISKRFLHWFAKGNLQLFALTLYLIAPTYFYMHRNDFLFQLNLTRNALVIWLIIYFCARFIHPKPRLKIRNNI